MSRKTRDLTDLFDTVSLGAPENAVGLVLWRVVHRYQREIDRALGAVDLTHLQFTILTLAAWLTRSGDPATQSELARFGEIHPMQVSLILKALEEKGMISRLPSASNVRAKRVEVTPSGVTTLRRALPLAIEVQRRLFGDDGRPGGKLLTALLRLDGEAPELAASSKKGEQRSKQPR
jgi:MarR family transcriptional regulator, organic hydroperoxide resistance regulator